MENDKGEDGNWVGSRGGRGEGGGEKAENCLNNNKKYIKNSLVK